MHSSCRRCRVNLKKEEINPIYLNVIYFTIEKLFGFNMLCLCLNIGLYLLLFSILLAKYNLCKVLVWVTHLFLILKLFTSVQFLIIFFNSKGTLGCLYLKPCMNPVNIYYNSPNARLYELLLKCIA